MPMKKKIMVNIGSGSSELILLSVQVLDSLSAGEFMWSKLTQNSISVHLANLQKFPGNMSPDGLWNSLD